jgi:hypothetical protein
LLGGVLAVELLVFLSFWNKFFQIQCVFGLPTVAYKYGLAQMVLFLGQISEMCCKKIPCVSLLDEKIINTTHFFFVGGFKARFKELSDWGPLSSMGSHF